MPDTEKDYGGNFRNSISNFYVCEIAGDEDYGTVFKATKVETHTVKMRSLKDDSIRDVSINLLGDYGFTAQIWSNDGRLCRAPLPPCD